MNKHPNKHIQEAIQFALDNGWHYVDSGKSSHAFCKLRCNLGHDEHSMSVWSTPSCPEDHARTIKQKVKKCKPLEKSNEQ